MIATAPVLKCYNPEEDLVLQCDSSETGLDGALLLAGHPVAFCSRALMPAEKGYANSKRMPGNPVWDGETTPGHCGSF